MNELDRFCSTTQEATEQVQRVCHTVYRAVGDRTGLTSVGINEQRERY